MPRISKQQASIRTPEKFRRLVNDALKKTDLPQNVIAERAGIDAGHLSRVLKSGKSLGKEKVISLAAVLDISREALLRAAGYEVGKSPITIDQVTMLHKTGGPPLRVVTDPRFVESAIFMWIFSQQPFRPAGIECILDKTDWRNIPEKVESESKTLPAIGFYNRRSVQTLRQQPFVRVNYWIDLCLYKGYAVIARPGLGAEEVESLEDANKYFKRLIADHKTRKMPKPTIIYIGGDTLWRLDTPLARDLISGEFAFEPIFDADRAFRRFLDGAGDLLIGGLPQRLAARQDKKKCVEVLHFKNNPLLFSLNSLIYSDALQNNQPILAAASGLWFKTIAKAKEDDQYLKSMQTGCLEMLENLQVDQHYITADLIRSVLHDEEFEIFPRTPTQLLEEMVEIVSSAFAIVRNKENDLPKIMDEILESVKETLAVEMQKDKYPALL